MAFTPKGVSESLKGISGDLDAILKQLREVDTLTKGIETHAGNAGNKIKAATTKAGSRGNGVGGSRVTTTNEDARFGPEVVGQRLKDVVSQHLGDFTESQNRIAMNNMKYSMVKSGFALAGALVTTPFNMLQDTGATIQRATSYYNAGVMSGFGGARPVMAQATLRAMGGGLTAAGNDAMIAQSMAMQGITFSGQSGSEYMRTAREVGNAAKYLNMDNASALQAVTGMTSGQGSQLMMNRFGIMTSDPRTGKTRTTAQIFGDLQSRLSNGRPMTVQGINDSFRRGYLGSSLRNSGLSDDQQQLFKQYLLEKAQGNNLDLNSNKDMAKLKADAAAAGNANPQDALQKINASNTAAMQNAENAFISGLNAAAGAIDGLNKVLAPFASSMGGLSSFMATMGGSPAGAGLLGGIGSIAGSAANMAGTAYMMKMMGGGGGGMLKGGGGGGGGLGGMLGRGAKGFGNALRGMGKTGIGKLGIAGNILGGGITAAQGIGTSHQGASIGRGIGEAAGGIGGWAAAAALAPETGGLSLLLPLVGSIVGNKVLGDVGAGIGGLFDSGNGGGNKASNVQGPKASGTWLIAPVEKYTAGAYWRAQNPAYWGADGHGGLDFQVPVGTAVKASAAGSIVSYTYSEGLGNHLVIDHGNGWSTVYCHLSSGKSSGTVKQGDPIGSSGNSGKTASGQQVGAHVHLALCQGANGNTAKAVDPTPYLVGGFPKTWTGSAGSSASSSASDKPYTVDNNGASTLSGEAFRRQLDFSNLVGSANSSLLSGGSNGASNSMSLSAALQSVGFKGSAYKTAYAVAMAASGGKSGKKSGSNYGFFQFNMNSAQGNELRRTYSLSSADAALDPKENALIAWDMSKHGKDFSAFDSYKNGAYKKFLSGGASASAGINYVKGDQPVNVHKGEAILDVDQAREWRQNQVLSRGNSKANVTINVTVAQASEAEAIRLAQMVKTYLSEDSLMSSMGSK